jgi:hypothetical protein
MNYMQLEIDASVIEIVGSKFPNDPKLLHAILPRSIQEGDEDPSHNFRSRQSNH